MNDDLYRPMRHDLPVSYGEFIGWRVWKVWRHGSLVRLGSVSADTIWQPRKMLEARCPGGHAHHVPDENCSCGFYTAKSREHLASLPYPHYAEDDVRVFGRVALAGKVIPGTQGWRSQYAWPVEVWVPTHAPALVPLLAKQYSIPVHTGNLVYTRRKERTA